MQKLLYLVFKVTKEEDLKTWTKGLADQVFEKFSKLGPGPAGAEDEDDTNAWLSQVLVFQLVALEDPRGQPCEVAAEFLTVLAMRFLAKCLDKADCEQEIQSFLATFKQTNADMSSSMRWKALGTSYVSLANVVTEDGDLIQDSEKCLAMVESSYKCLLAAIALLSNAGLFQSKSEDDYDDLDYEETERPGTMERDALYQLFQNFESLIETIVSKSRRSAMNQPHIRRVNYMMNTIQRYFSLHKALFHRERPVFVLQGSLESWVSSKQKDDDRKLES